MTKRVVIYTRVSTEEQAREGHSLEAQYDICAKFASSRNWNIVDHLQDAGKSGKSDNRTGFQKMIGYVRSGQCDVVLTHKLDRFSRNIVHILTYMREFAKLEVSYCSANEQFDFTTPMGKVMLAMLAAFAEWYLDNLSAETAKGKKQRAKKGLWNGLPPLGYQSNDTGDLEVVPGEAELIKVAFEKYATGVYSYADIAVLLNGRGLRTRPWGASRGKPRPFTKDASRAMLTNPFYAGRIAYRGRDARKRGQPLFSTDGQHTAIISAELFDQVQRARNQRFTGHRGKANYATAVYPGTGLLYCQQCNTRLRGGKLRGVRHYRDPHTEYEVDCDLVMWRNAEEVEAQVGAFFSDIKLPADWKGQIMGRLDVEDPEQTLRQRSKLEAQINRAKQLFLWGDISEDGYHQEMAALRIKLADLRPPRHHEVFAAGELLNELGLLWQRANLHERKRLMAATIDCAYVGEQSVTAVMPKAPIYAAMQPAFDEVALAGEKTCNRKRSRRDSNPRSLP